MLEGHERFELPATGFEDQASIQLMLMSHCLERVARIELANSPWQGLRLPLHHTRITGGEYRNRTYPPITE